MKCSKCGKEFNEGNFCPQCGTKYEEKKSICPQCGSELETEWKACPKCGEQLHEEKNKRTKGKQKRLSFKKGLIALCIIALIWMIINLFSGSSSDEKGVKIESVKQGTYGKYTSVTVGEVLEYNWENGEWDSYESEDNGSTVEIVEYSVGENRENLIQFAVEEDSFSLVYMKQGDQKVERDTALDLIDDMYFSYFKEKYPINDIDLNDYIDKSAKDLLDECNAFYETDKEAALIEDVSRQVMIVCDDEKITTIKIAGDSSYLPMFAGFEVGEGKTDISTEQLKEYGYTVEVYDDNSCSEYGNPEDSSVIMFEFDGNGLVSSITWQANILEEIGGETLDETTEEKSTIDFIGMEGTYICLDAEEDWITGKIDILSVGENSVSFALGTLDFGYDMISGEAEIISSNQARYVQEGFGLNFEWSDGENIYVTNEGELTEYMDAATIDVITEGMRYYRDSEFNQW